ncbi:M13 family metallopeptidase [Massilia sp. PAMC28688]|uniref:M13 family metallopeptidase n=1 Tax=Massilia sp. PAMC28688 TaxID=2861283 RepID=UPI001C637978|nr:M13 family metallopeptidase [Massilia sp. PAMC28688]QYF94091.1 M13 family metallopeptidase [Massilia sp. PAMC28688]
MNFRCKPLNAAIALALCGATLAASAALAAAASAAGQAPAPAPAAKPAAAAVLPGDDFFAYANGEWLAKTDIPADRSSWGGFAIMAERTNERIVKLIEAVAADKNASGDARRVADYYSAYLDEAGIEARGLAPLKPMLKQIDAINSKTALARALGSSLRADVDPLNNTNFHTENLFGLWVAQGLDDPTRNTPYLLQGGLGMPDRAYYLTESARMATLRTKYQDHIAAMLRLAGYSEPDMRAARVMALETRIAQAHATREDSSDVQKGNNKWSRKDFAVKAPGMDWNAFFKAARLDKADNFIVWHPDAVAGAATLVESADIEVWRDYLAFHKINHLSSTLPKAFGDQAFLFRQALSGTPQQAARWKRALGATNYAMDEAVGRLYVERYFPAENKVRLKQMVSNIIGAFSKRIDALDWMAPATRAQAQEKLRTMYVGIGYPDRWMSFDGLKVARDDAFGNAVRAEQFHYDRAIAKLGQKVDKTAWSMPPQLVNAVNLPLQNAMNFPAAILQPPFFDPQASDAANYGAIGSIIGHEISHSFDDQGAQFDAQGRLRDWWTKGDMDHFKKAANRLVDQFSAYQPFPDLNVNGQLTLSENLADLAGVAAAHDAYRATLAGKDAPADADQQFFTGYARAWQSKMREPAYRQQVLTDGHAPAPYRTAIVRNLDAWYKAFNVQPGQALYLAPAERVKVW